MRALRKGWIQTTEQRKVTREEPPAYLLWADDGVASDKIANGEQLLAALPACPWPGRSPLSCPATELRWQSTSAGHAMVA